MRRDARLALRLVLNQHIRPRPAATQTTAAPRLRRLGLRLGPRGQVDVASLVLRGRTKDASDPVVARVFQLPNELCWHVLKFWRATSDATGEVI